jgi:epoxyqueuosine reductase QueG
MVKLSEIAGTARSQGAPLVGSVPVELLGANREGIENVLDGAKSVVVLAAPHSRSAIEAKDVHAAQYDTIHAYEEVGRSAHAVARWLEARGYRAVAVPAFIPLDMSPPKYGMRGAVDWRSAAVKAGIGGYGENGLLLTWKFGPAVRLGGVVTDAEIQSVTAAPATPCTHCMRCVEACPSGALTGQGKIDKKRCGDKIFSTGFRAWRDFLVELIEAPPEKREEMVGRTLSLDLWQNFMTGNYYTCFACQAVCRVGRTASG